MINKKPKNLPRQGSIKFSLDNGTIVAEVDLPSDNDTNTENFRATQFATMLALVQRGQVDEIVDKAIIKAGVLGGKDEYSYNISSKLQIMLYPNDPDAVANNPEEERVKSDEAFTKDRNPPEE